MPEYIEIPDEPIDIEDVYDEGMDIADVDGADDFDEDSDGDE